jgi:glycosyltransferase involved in cell wall biosynthesis
MRRPSRLAMVSAIHPESHSTCYLLEELQKLMRLDIIATRVPRGYRVSHKNVRECWERGGPFVRKIMRAVLDLRLTVLHVQHEFPLYGGVRGVLLFPFLLLLLRLLRVKTLVSIHGIYPTSVISDGWCRTFGLRVFPLSRGIYRAAFAFFYKSTVRLADAVHVNSNAAKLDLVRDYAAEGRRVHVVPLGVPAPAGDVAPPCRPWASLLTDDVILAFGYILPRKGLEVLLDAYPEIKRRAPGAKLCIAGEDLPAHRAYADRLRADIRERFAPEDVVVTGPVSHSEMLWLFGRCAIAVFPYATPAGSSGPLTLALQAACPVVATDFDVFREVVTQYGYGLLVEPGSASALAVACAEILGRPDLRRELCRRAALAAEAMSWSRVAARMRSIYAALDGGLEYRAPVLTS